VKNRNTFGCALAEAAYMTGLERNADVVRMASYAPLFANAEAWQWTPDLIWVDGLDVTLTPNYYVQQLFAHNHGVRVLPATLRNVAGAQARRLYASATRDANGDVVVKLVNASDDRVALRLNLTGVEAAGAGTETVLTAPLEATNTPANHAVAPRTHPFAPGGPRFGYDLPATSLVILRVPAK
jgi:alpha-N-arabinofuranosidase